MRALAWIPFGLLVGFLAGYGVPVSIDLLPLLAVTLLAAGYFLISTSRALEQDEPAMQRARIDRQR
ncbi:MAG TPA: hypothetical protein VH951_13585 [Dehalococcoidia bacterium]